MGILYVCDPGYKHSTILKYNIIIIIYYRLVVKDAMYKIYVFYY